MINEPCRSYLLAVADAYADATGLSLPTVGNKFYGNQTFFGELAKRKRTVSLAKYDEVMAKFSAEWPKGAAWPKSGKILLRRPKTNIPVKNGGGR